MTVIIRRCELFFKTVGKNKNPAIIDLIKLWVGDKIKNPLSKIGHGGSDYPFTSTLAGYNHAKLTQDISIVYKLHGAEPKFLDLYAVVTHQEIGTSKPQNINKQRSFVQRLGNQSFNK